MLEYATLGQMADQVGRQIQNSSADRAVKIKEWINTHYAQVARSHRWKELLRLTEATVTITASQRFIYLPKEAEQVYLVFPQASLGPLLGMSLDQMIDRYGTNSTLDAPTYNFAEAGETGYCTDFYTTGETLHLAHSGSGTVSAVVHGLISGTEGSTAATELVETCSILQSTGCNTTNTWKDLIAVSVDELATGDVVTITGNTSARTYGTIAAGERTARYRRIRLMQSGPTADTVTMVWKKRVSRLVEDHQVVEIPVGQVLIDLVVSTMLSSTREYGGATLHYQAAQIAVETLKGAEATDGSSIQQAIPAVSLRRGYRYGGWMQ